MVTTFTSLAFEKGLAAAEKIKPGQKGAWPEEKLKRWLAGDHHNNNPFRAEEAA